MTVQIVAGIDLGGTAVNYTFLDECGQFLIEELYEHPARSVEGPAVCLQQIVNGLGLAAKQADVRLADVVAVGLDTPGPASAGLLAPRARMKTKMDVNLHMGFALHCSAPSKRPADAFL